MATRRISSLVIALVVSAVALVPGRAAALPAAEGLAHLPVHGPVSPHGTFVGHLTIAGVTVGDAGQLCLTGVLDGIATHRTGAKTQVSQQAFTALATPIDSDRTTDVLLLKLAPIAFAPGGWQVALDPIALDIYAIPGEVDLLAMLMDEE